MITFIFEVTKDSTQEQVAIVADSLRAAEAELRTFGILFCGGVTFVLKEILGLNHSGFFYYLEAAK